MYEDYYGLKEKPFSLTPDPKFLYRSQSHANAFDLLQYAIERREGFAVITGDIGTGKTTLCRALLEQIDRTTFTALVLNPFLSEEDLLKRVLQDFGVVSPEDLKAGRFAAASKQDLIDALYDFLLGLIPLNASAVLIIDEAQNLSLQLLEQIRILSNLETDKEKLLQIILVGQLNLRALLRSPGLRQLDQRVSIRYELTPLDSEAVGAYVSHRLLIAGGSASVTFTAKALDLVHRLSGGIPRLINLICDRALLAGFSVQTSRITPDIVKRAAASLELQGPVVPSFGGFRRTSLLTASAVVLSASVGAVGAAAYLYQQMAMGTVHASGRAPGSESAATQVPMAPAGQSDIAHDRDGGGTSLATADAEDRQLPAQAAFTILVRSFQMSGAGKGRAESETGIRSVTEWLERFGFDVYYADVDLGPRGRWQRVLAGAYTDAMAARAGETKLRQQGTDARAVTAAFATGALRAAASGATRASAASRLRR
jgi:type II secretory pathway predicted ATPase ExeA